MKKIFYIIPLLLASLTACQKEELGGQDDPNAVRINATIGEVAIENGNPLSRTAPTAPAAEDKWQTGDQIAVSAGGASVVYTYGNSAWTATGSDYLKWEKPTMTFTAYHPVGDGVSISDFTLPTDQSTAAKIAKADYMTFSGDKTRTAGSPTVDLALSRKTARIILNVTAGAEFDGQSPTISNVRINSAYAGYTSSAASGNTTAITPCVVNEKYYALVIPTAAAASKTFITLTVTYAGGTKDLTLTGIPALTAANSYTINLTAGRDRLSIGSISVADWSNSEVMPGGEAESLVDVYEYFVSGNYANPGRTYLNGTQLQGDAYNAFTIATTVANNKIYSVDKYLNVFIDGVKQYSIENGTVNPNNILHKYASIVVSGGDIYVSVSVDINDDREYVPYVWKNGNRVTLPQNLQKGYVTSMTLADGNIYIYVYDKSNRIGYIYNLTNNMIAHTLASGEENYVVGMAKVGNNLYSAGFNLNKDRFLRVWKNDNVIFSRDDATEVSAIALVDNTLYLSVNTFVNDNLGDIIIYKGDISVDNPQFKIISEIKRNDGNSFANSNDIAIAPNGDIYIAGQFGRYSGSYPAVWKNGKVYHTYNAQEDINGQIYHFELVSK